MSNSLSKLAMFAQAAYASLDANQSCDVLASALARQVEISSFVAPQATQFASDQTVVLQYNDTSTASFGVNSGLSATVFADGAGNLTLAIRGTQLTDGKDLLSDGFITWDGVGYDQIVALANWWRKVSSPPGTVVQQYAVDMTSHNQPDAIFIPSNGNGGLYLVRASDATATGELFDPLHRDPDKQLDVTGHSLGGHLAMAFGSLFGGATASVTTFNAPGFINNPSNQNFFNRLSPGAGVPVGAKTTNVIGVGPALPAIAGLHSRPGIQVDVPLEDQTAIGEPSPPPAFNHSQMILADSLAVKALVDRLQATDLATYNTLLKSSSKDEYASLERVVDSVEALVTGNTALMPAGNAQREALYSAMNTLSNNGTFAGIAGKVTLNTSFDASAATTDFAAFASLALGTTFQMRTSDYATMDALGQVNAGLYAAWNADIAAKLTGGDPLELNFTGTGFDAREAAGNDRDWREVA